VILRAAPADPPDPRGGSHGEAFRERWRPVVSAETLVFHDRKASFDPRVLVAIRDGKPDADALVGDLLSRETVPPGEK
jgi:hypothetical protein